MRDDAALRRQKAAIRLQEDGQIGRQVKRRITTAELGPVDRLVGQAVVPARAKRALVDPLSCLDDPSDVEELFARLGLEFAPQLVSPSEERHVVGVLEVREPDDPREPVRRPHVVRNVEALESEHALPAAG